MLSPDLLIWGIRDYAMPSGKCSLTSWRGSYVIFQFAKMSMYVGYKDLKKTDYKEYN